MSQTPYGAPDPPKTPYGKQGLSWKLWHGRTCPSCGSTHTVRRYYEGKEASCRGCALEACLFPLELLLWPVIVVFELVWIFSKKRQECVCLDCGHEWRSYL